MKASPEYPNLEVKCPIGKTVCPIAHCPYQKRVMDSYLGEIWVCDFPFIGKIRAIPDIVLAKGE